MATRDGSTARRFRLAPRQPRWRLVLAVAPVLLLSLVALGFASYRATSAILRQQALQRLQAFRANAAREIEQHFSRVESHVVSLAHDSSTLLALRQLSDATVQLDNDPLTEPARMRPQMESLKRFLENYYRQELNDGALDLRALLLPQRSAVWLQATYVADRADPAAKALPSTPKDATPYDRVHSTWDPVFQGMLDRFEFEDVYLADAISGRLVYSARKQPDFQTSLLEGPYAATAAGTLFRNLQQSAPGDGRYRIVDLAPYPPAHGVPAAFAGAPILDHGRVAGALIVRLSSAPLTRLLSADGKWSAIGLGETGEAYLVGRGDGDSLMRTEPRFAPGVGGTTALPRQPVVSQATSQTENADEFEGEYINYRGVPVLGSVGRLPHLDGLNWTLITEISSAEALRPLLSLRSRTIWLAGLLFIGVLLLTIALSAVVAAPPPAAPTSTGASDGHADDYRQRLEAELRPVITAVVAASEGDLSQRIAVDGDTLGKLPHALNRMWRGAGALVSHVHNTAAAAIDSAQQIHTAVGQLSQDAAQHATALTTTSTLLRETQRRLDALATEATTTRQAGQVTDSAACQSTDAIARIADGMEAIQKHARTLTMKLKRLGERSMEISTVIATIQEITAHANMLALNATIEASRAGEHGLGFKAVANDVRKLAARTEAAAKDMAELVTTLHGEAADAVDCIDTQAEEIERQTLRIADAGQALGRYRDVVSQNGKQSGTSSAATGEQTHATSALSDAVQRVAEFVRRTHVLSEQAVHSSAALLSMLSELNTWAQTFRVRAASGSSAQPSTHADVIELAPQETVGNGRGARA